MFNFAGGWEKETKWDLGQLVEQMQGYLKVSNYVIWRCNQMAKKGRVENNGLMR